MSASELLANTLSPDANTRQNATQTLENASRENFPQYVEMMSAELANESSAQHVRNAAGLALKNALAARENERQTEYANRWLSLDPTAREKIKQESLVTLGSPNTKAGGVAAQVVAAIAAVELPHDQWPDLIGQLLGFMNNPQSTTNLKIATLQGIGYICESIKPETLALRSNEILTAVIHGARKEEPSSDVQLAAILALFNSLEFVRENFDREGERNYIMQVAAEYGEAPETESKFFAKIALPEIVPVLLQLLTRQEEDADEDEWTIAMSAGTCLNHLAQAVTDAIVPAVIPFIEGNIKSTDWHDREAAVMTFGSILDGPDPTVLSPLVNQALPLLIDMMTDSNLHVKDTTAWTLGRICDLLITCIRADDHLHPLITAVVNGLQDNPRIVANCCWALMNLADQLGTYYEDDAEAAQSGPLSPYYEGVVQALLRVTETTSNENNFRTSAYEAITSYVNHATPDVIPVVEGTIVTILQRMEHLLSVQNQILGVDDRNNWNELQSNFCGVAIGVIRRLGNGIQPLADRIMTLILQLIQAAGKTSTVLEDAFLVVGSLAAALEANFSPYIQAFLPFLYPALQSHEDTQLCTVAVGIIGDISRALGEQSAQYSNNFMNLLLENLQSEVLNRNVKISILTCFGDIALAIGPAFEPYLDTTMGVLRQAGAVQPNPLDFDLVDYVAQLREGILEAYTGITTGFKNTDKEKGRNITPANPIHRVQLLLPHVQSILELIQRCLTDDERTESMAKSAFGLLGDLADSFPNGQIKQLLLQEWITSELRNRRGMTSEVKKTMRWAKEASTFLFFASGFVLIPLQMVKRSTA
ncbi:hypothetical protein HWV62_10120 [Athelia sp. TMB]|nr:hypothetical protein HWV62_10120 [Athelia sp. TMB]